MQRSLEAIFPIKDAASAALMAIKADCLRKARIISDQEKQWVDSRVRTFLHDAVLRTQPDPVWGRAAALHHRHHAFQLVSLSRHKHICAATDFS
jgi:hypothetical protein